MNQYVKMILFVIILGTITSVLLLGGDYLTRDLIEANKEADLKSAILDSNDISYTFSNIHDVFSETINTIELDGLTFYEDKETGSISYMFNGGGVWGPIIGIITLESDFETIQSIKILQQEETPGLGGVIAEPNYLSTFIGIKMVPQIEINKDTSENAANEIDAITGATRTSKAVELILNEAYTEHKTAWDNQD
ncbi:MAG: FMN-binding protein [Acholeplasmataceae bacterium]|nr:FMN-binding protein [Acholeplasmataceae bacterium]